MYMVLLRNTYLHDSAVDTSVHGSTVNTATHDAAVRCCCKCCCYYCTCCCCETLMHMTLLRNSAAVYDYAVIVLLVPTSRDRRVEVDLIWIRQIDLMVNNR